MIPIQPLPLTVKFSDTISPLNLTRHLTLILRYSVTFHDRRIGDGTYACDTARGQSDH